MDSVDFLDEYLDPPDDPRFSECDGCGGTFRTEDLTHINGHWACDECLKQEGDVINFDATKNNVDREGFPLVTAEPVRVCPICLDTIPDDRDWNTKRGCCQVCAYYEELEGKP